MGRTQKEYRIDGESYRISHLGAREAHRIEIVVSNALSGALPAMIALRQGAGRKMAPVEYASAINLSGLSADDYIAICLALASQCEFSPEPGRWLPLDTHYDDHFAGRLMHHKMWLLEALRHNFPDFFARAVAHLKATAEPAEAGS